MRCQLDRGVFDYLSRAEAQELARARRGKLEVSTYALSAREALAGSTSSDPQHDALGYQAPDVESLAAQHSAAHLARKVREIVALARRADAGHALDPWQLRKVHRLPTLRAALRTCRHLQGDVGGSLLRATSEAPAEQGQQTDLVIDEDLRQLLVEVVKKGQGQEASWCSAWRHVTEVDGSRDPGGRSADFLVAFLHKRVAGPRRPRPWLVNYREALRAAGVDALLGTTRSARARSEAAPALGRPMSASTPEGAGEQGCAATSTSSTHSPRAPGCQETLATSPCWLRTTSASGRFRSDCPTLGKMGMRTSSRHAGEVVALDAGSQAQLAPGPRSRGRSPPAAARSSAAQHSNVFVGDLQPGMDKTTLETACSGYGRVVSCNFLPQSRGHAGRAALVKFETRQAAETAVETLVELGWTARFADRDVSVPRSASASASRWRQSRSATPARQWRPKPAPSPGRGQTRPVLNEGADGVEVPIFG